MSAADDLKSIDRLDQVVLGTGIAGLVFSFFGFVGKSFGPITYTESAWHGLGILGMLLVLAATVVAGTRVFASGSLPKMAIGVNLLTAVLSGLGTLFLVIHGFAASRDGISLGLRFAGVIVLILFIVQAVAAVMVFRKSEEALPDFKAMSANRTATGQTAPTAPPVVPYPPSTPTTSSAPATDVTVDSGTAEPPAPTA